MQEESSIKLDRIKRETEEARQRARLKTQEENAKREQETYKIKATADAEARALEKKLTETLRRRELADLANKEREKWVAAINATFEHIGGISDSF